MFMTRMVQMCIHPATSLTLPVVVHYSYSFGIAIIAYTGERREVSRVE